MKPGLACEVWEPKQNSALEAASVPELNRIPVRKRKNIVVGWGLVGALAFVNFSLTHADGLHISACTHMGHTDRWLERIQNWKITTGTEWYHLGSGLASCPSSQFKLFKKGENILACVKECAYRQITGDCFLIRVIFLHEMAGKISIVLGMLERYLFWYFVWRK